MYQSGALVISLDFELFWGVHDTLGAEGGYVDNLVGAREAIPRMLDLFAEYGVGATWATVGFLFADGREEMEQFFPEIRPTYMNPRRDPYRIPAGKSERQDPLRFAPSLIRQIASVPGQEIGSHTFSHYYSLEPGQTAEQFRADLDAAVRIASAKGYALRSLVVPRHQVRADYFPAIAGAGFVAHRSNERNSLNGPSATGKEPLIRRGLRLMDSYVSITGPNSVEWGATRPRSGLVDIRESRFLRPYQHHLSSLDPLRIHRIIASMESAAKHGRVFHLWWHPHNFGTNIVENLAALRKILATFDRLRDGGLMNSYSMGQVAELSSVSAVADATDPVPARATSARHESRAHQLAD